MIVALLALSLMAAPAYAISVKQFTNNFATGSSADHEEVIAMVYNNTGAALESGDVLVWDTTNDDGRSVTKGNRLGQPVAGVANEDIAASSWGKMLVYGYHSALKVYGAAGYNVTAGYPLYSYGTNPIVANTTSTYDGYAGVGQVVASFTSALNTPFGTALDTYTSTGTESTIEAFVDCL